MEPTDFSKIDWEEVKMYLANKKLDLIPKYASNYPIRNDKFDHEFDKLFEVYIHPGVFPALENKPQVKGHLYHGTSLRALDLILEEGVMQPPIVLIKRGKLISGEMKKDLGKNPNQDLNGPKFMSRQALLKLGVVFPGDHHIYEFGHAWDVFFSTHPLGAIDYASRDEPKAIIGIQQSIAEFYGSKFIDGKSEGILHEGAIGLEFPLRQLFVPKERVQEYREKAKLRYLAQVYPIEDVRWREEIK